MSSFKDDRLLTVSSCEGKGKGILGSLINKGTNPIHEDFTLMI